MTPHLLRFARQPANQARVDGLYHPWGTEDTPMVMHMSLVQIGPDGIAYQDMTPIITANGAPVPATAPHTWFQLYAAGHP